MKKHSVSCHSGDLRYLFLEGAERAGCKEKNRLLASALQAGHGCPRNLAVEGVVRITVWGPDHQGSRDLGTSCLRTRSPVDSGAGSGAVG